MENNKKLIIILFSALVIVACALLAINFLHQPTTAEGEKTITVEVIAADGQTKEFTIQTEAEFLRGALEQNDLIEGNEGEYGMYVTTVDGITADESQRQWWCFNDADGVMLNTSVDGVAIADGDHFQAVLSTY